MALIRAQSFKENSTTHTTAHGTPTPPTHRFGFFKLLPSCLHLLDSLGYITQTNILIDSQSPLMSWDEKVLPYSDPKSDSYKSQTPQTHHNPYFCKSDEFNNPTLLVQTKTRHRPRPTLIQHLLNKTKPI